jgi:hypothetical protein
MSEPLIAEGTQWGGLSLIACALLALLGGGVVSWWLVRWVGTRRSTLQLGGTPLHAITLKEWAALLAAVMSCTVVFLITFVPLIPFWWLREGWLARNYHVEPKPANGGG